MAYCPDCNHYFPDEDCMSRREYRGEHFGSPAYETWNACPYCGDDNLVWDEYLDSYLKDGGIMDKDSEDDPVEVLQDFLWKKAVGE